MVGFEEKYLKSLLNSCEKKLVEFNEELEDDCEEKINHK